MIARVIVSLLAAIAIVACASIDPPAGFTPNEAGTNPGSGDSRKCRILPRTFAGNATARLYGTPGGGQAVCVSLQLAVSGASNCLATFCVAGPDLATATRQTARNVGLDPNTCAYCVDVQTNCATVDGGIAEPCNNAYAPTSGSMRIVKLGANPGDDVWIDVGDLTIARIDALDRDAGTFVVEPKDCLTADGLTFQGKLVAATCTDDSTECWIARSASSRLP